MICRADCVESIMTRLPCPGDTGRSILRPWQMLRYDRKPYDTVPRQRGLTIHEFPWQRTSDSVINTNRQDRRQLKHCVAQHESQTLSKCYDTARPGDANLGGEE